MEKHLGVGTRIRHAQYGEGFITAVKFSSYNAYFHGKGRVELSKDLEGIEVVDHVPHDDDMVSLDEVESVIIKSLQKYSGMGPIVDLGEKWKGGKMLLQPADKSLKPKEIPIENFFHKIVMLRDRLRVLEQNINSNTKLSDEEKVNIQQYITRCYGSLTTFNVLFKRPEDQFAGEKGE